MKIHLEFNFWLWLCRISFKRLKEFGKNMPDGVPTIRSVGNECKGYSPRKPRAGDYQDCETDGHYLCDGCCHNIKNKL